jgi:hypothetical protein
MTKQQPQAGHAGTARPRTSVPILVAMPVAGAAMLLAACTTSTTTATTASPAQPSKATVSSSPAASASPAPKPSTSASVSAAACQHVKSLRGSLVSITHVSFTGGSATVITADLKNMQAQLAALKGEPALAAATNQLQASVNNVMQAAKGMKATPSASQARAVVNALTNLKTTAAPIVGQLKAACP